MGGRLWLWYCRQAPACRCEPASWRAIAAGVAVQAFALSAYAADAGGGPPSGTLFNGMLDIANALGLGALAHAVGAGANLAVTLLVLLVLAVMVLPTAIVLSRRRSAGLGTAQPGTIPSGSPAGATTGAARGVATTRGTGSQRLHVEGASSRQQSFGQLGVPAGFDTPAFLTNAKLYFGRLQQAWGRGDLNALEQFTSPALFTALTHELRARRDTSPRSTHVVSLDAQLLGIESSEREHIASVHFSGTLSVDGNNESIDEVWNLTRATSGQGGWVLAGIQQLN